MRETRLTYGQVLHFQAATLHNNPKRTLGQAKATDRKERDQAPTFIELPVLTTPIRNCSIASMKMAKPIVHGLFVAVIFRDNGAARAFRNQDGADSLYR